MKFTVRFIFFLGFLLSMGHGHLKAISQQYEHARASYMASEEPVRADHCRVRTFIITTSPFWREKDHNEIEIPSTENREEDENEEEDEGSSLAKNDYFTTFFYSQAPSYFSGCSMPYFDLLPHRFSRCIAFQVFRI